MRGRNWEAMVRMDSMVASTSLSISPIFSRSAARAGESRGPVKIWSSPLKSHFKLVSTDPTWAIRIKAPKLDETSEAGVVARHLGTEPIVVDHVQITSTVSATVTARARPAPHSKDRPKATTPTKPSMSIAP